MDAVEVLDLAPWLLKGTQVLFQKPYWPEGAGPPGGGVDAVEVLPVDLAQGYLMVHSRV